MSWGIKLLRAKKGSVLTQVLVATVVTMALAYYLSELVVQQSGQSKKTADMLEARIVLHSLLDYTMYGVSKRWCFNDSWLKDNSEGCNLANPYATERLIMNDGTVAIIEDMIRNGTFQSAYSTDPVTRAPSLKLSRIERTLSVDGFATTHPLFKVLNSINKSNVSYIKFLIERDLRAAIPVVGNEVYLSFTVQLLNDNRQIIEVAGAKLELKSYVGVYPREVGTFALLTPNNLYLTEPPAGVIKGDHVIPVFASREEALEYEGLQFDSPVFVNGDIHLPTQPVNEDESSPTQYNATIFNEKVHLAGRLYRNGRPFAQSSTSGLTNMWIHNRQFGGFMRGIHLESARDRGLDVLADIVAGGAATNVDLMRQCIRKNEVLSNISTTSDSRLRVNASRSNNTAQFKMYLTEGNRFQSQGGVSYRDPSQTWPSGWSSTRYLDDVNQTAGRNNDRRPIFNYEITFYKTTDNSRLFTLSDGEVADNGGSTRIRLNDFPVNDLNDRVRRLRNELDRATVVINGETLRGSDIEREIRNLESSISTLENEIQRLRTDISTIEQQIADEDFGSGETRESKEAELTAKNEELATKETNLESLRSQLTVAQGKMSTFRESVSDKTQEYDEKSTLLNTINSAGNPQFSVRVRSYNENHNPSFRDLDINFENPAAFVGPDGSPLRMEISIYGYDVGFYRRYNFRWWGSLLTDMRANIQVGPSGVTVDNNITDYKVNTWNSDSSNNRLLSIPSDADENFNIDLACSGMGSGLSAFGGAGWDVDFSPNTKHSWSFTNETPAPFSLGLNNASTRGEVVFHVQARASDCRITRDADFVAGFFVCDRLIIDGGRDRPLRIIGSIITNSLDIAPEAIRRGIRWSSVYHPQSVVELQRVGILKADGRTCDSVDFPIWHPRPAMTDIADSYKCSSRFLREKAQPFQWTSVNPDCGIVPGSNSNQTRCKNRLLNFQFIEVSREGAL